MDDIVSKLAKSAAEKRAHGYRHGGMGYGGGGYGGGGYGGYGMNPYTMGGMDMGYGGGGMGYGGYGGGMGYGGGGMGYGGGGMYGMSPYLGMGSMGGFPTISAGYRSPWGGSGHYNMMDPSFRDLAMERGQMGNQFMGMGLENQGINNDLLRKNLPMADTEIERQRMEAEQGRSKDPLLEHAGQNFSNMAGSDYSKPLPLIDNTKTQTAGMGNTANEKMQYYTSQAASVREAMNRAEADHQAYLAERMKIVNEGNRNPYLKEDWKERGVWGNIANAWNPQGIANQKAQIDTAKQEADQENIRHLGAMKSFQNQLSTVDEQRKQYQNQQSGSYGQLSGAEQKQQGQALQAGQGMIDRRQTAFDTTQKPVSEATNVAAGRVANPASVLPKPPVTPAPPQLPPPVPGAAPKPAPNPGMQVAGSDRVRVGYPTIDQLIDHASRVFVEKNSSSVQIKEDKDMLPLIDRLALAAAYNGITKQAGFAEAGRQIAGGIGHGLGTIGAGIAKGTGHLANKINPEAASVGRVMSANVPVPLDTIHNTISGATRQHGLGRQLLNAGGMLGGYASGAMESAPKTTGGVAAALAALGVGGTAYGLSGNDEEKQGIAQEYAQWQHDNPIMGTGARLLMGNTPAVYLNAYQDWRHGHRLRGATRGVVPFFDALAGAPALKPDDEAPAAPQKVAAFPLGDKGGSPWGPRTTEPKSELVRLGERTRQQKYKGNSEPVADTVKRMGLNKSSGALGDRLQPFAGEDAYRFERQQSGKSESPTSMFARKKPNPSAAPVSVADTLKRMASK